MIIAPAAFAQSSRPGMGSIPYGDSGGTGVTFRVWAPNASSVKVGGDFNGWGKITMVSEGNGNWSIDVNGARAGQAYKYYVNNLAWKRDPRARRVTSSTGNSIIYDVNAFDWGTNAIPQPARNDLVIYQMHLGTFEGGTPPRTFDHAITRLDHVRNLGINAIKLMPVNEFPGGLSWGYNPADQFAIETDYGSADGLKRFVKACHARGIAVIMDVVHNHYGPTDMDMWRIDGWYVDPFGGIYFYNDNRGYTPWGTTRPDFGRPEVYSFIRDQIMMYVQEYRIGGFRWDSVYNIINTDAGYNQQGEYLLRDINWELSQTYPYVERGAEDNAFDYSMNFQNKWDVGYRWDLHGQVVTAADVDRNMYTVKNLLDGWPGLHRVVFTEAHDYIARNHSRSRLPTEIDSADPYSIWARKRALLAAGIVMTTPGIPMIFQGQEMNETLAFHDDTPLRWTHSNTYAGIVRAYSDMIHLRRNLEGGTPGLKGSGINVHHVDNNNKVVAYVRWDAGGGTDDAVGIANFAATKWTNGNYWIEFPSAGTWYRHFNSDSTNYAADFGNIGYAQVEASGTPAGAFVNMGMYSLQIYSKTVPGSLQIPPSVTFDPASPTGCSPVTITYDAGTGPLQGASQVYIHIGCNGWTNVLDPDPAMTSLGSNHWRYVYDPPADTYELNMVFNNGAGVWDNNNAQDWSVAIEGCISDPSTNATQIAFTTAEQTVVSNIVSGLVSIQLQNDNGAETAAASNMTISLASSQSGTFRSSNDTANITFVVISNGKTSASFRYISSQLGEHLLSASHDALFDATQRLTVIAAPIAYDLAVLGNGAVIADDSGTPNITNHTDFGEVYAGTNLVRTYSITNMGTQAVSIGSVTTTGTHAADFVVISQPPASLNAGQTAAFQVRFQPAQVGLRTAALSFANTTVEKNPYNFAVGGTGTAPVISAAPGSLSPSVTLGGTPANAMLSITNAGTGILNYSIATNQNWLSVSPSAGSLAAAAGQTHTVSYSVGALGTGVYSAVITVSGAYATNSPKTVSVTLTIGSPTPASQLQFTTPVRTILAGETSDLITVGLFDTNNQATVSSGSTVVNLASDRPGTFRNADNTANIISITISNGKHSASFRYTASATGPHILTASDNAAVLDSDTQSLMVNGYVTDVYDATGQFIVPAGVTQVVVEAWGGGGGARQVDGSTYRRAGGGGGAYARATLAVVPGTTNAVVVGAGGAADDPGVNGGDSWFGDGSQILAKGGGGALVNNNPGPGGSSSLSISIDGIRYAGGAGGARSDVKTGGGGGGGGSAFTNASGAAGSKGGSTTGGAGGAGTGAGGAGGAPNNAGQKGNVPGGGGGGAGTGSSISGAGATGCVAVTYLAIKTGTAAFNPPSPSGCVDVMVSYNPSNGPLDGASTIVMHYGRNGWRDAADISLTNGGGGVWSATVAIADGTYEWNILFHDGGGTWDSNGGQEWTLPVSACWFPPGILTADPAFPQGCVPVHFTYSPGGSVLEAATNVYLQLGHNGWLNQISLAMTNMTGGAWGISYAIPEGTWQLDCSLHDGNGVWDNNNGDNWEIYVTGCSVEENQNLMITNPAADVYVPYTQQILTIRGIVTNIQSALAWENTMTGESGTIPANAEWSVAAVDLELGANLFRISGTNSTANPNDGARDSATNAVYTSAGTWLAGQNGGTQWGTGWVLTATANSGHFLASTNEANLSVGPQAWGLWANSGGLSEAVRPFADRLHEGDVFTLRFDNNWIEAGSSVGIGLRNGYNENLCEFFFAGGGTNYVINDAQQSRNTGIPWTGDGLNIAFELLTPTVYRVTANGTTITGTFAAATETMARQFRTWNYSSGAGTEFNLYVNDLAISGAPLDSTTLTAERTIYRKYGPHYYLSPTGDQFIWGLTFPVTEIGFIYDVYAKTNLLDESWQPMGYNVAGNGNPLDLYLTNQIERVYIRTGVQPAN
ncbi:MAG: alpha-amylase family glycosyl hydrolase [Kiritimatiellia bacterium]